MKKVREWRIGHDVYGIRSVLCFAVLCCAAVPLCRCDVPLRRPGSFVPRALSVFRAQVKALAELYAVGSQLDLEQRQVHTVRGA